MTCPACGGPMSRGAELCRSCTPRARRLGVQMLLKRITSVQIKVFHGKAHALDGITGNPIGTAKREMLNRLELTSVKQLSEDEAEDVLEQFDVLIEQHRTRARGVDEPVTDDELSKPTERSIGGRT